MSFDPLNQHWSLRYSDQYEWKNEMWIVVWRYIVAEKFHYHIQDILLLDSIYSMLSINAMNFQYTVQLARKSYTVKIVE